MTAINNGAATEGIFGIVLGFVLAYDKVSIDDVRKYRRMTDPQKITSTGQTLKLPDNHDRHGDTISVEVHIKLRQNAVHAFGENIETFESLNESVLDRLSQVMVQSVARIPSVGRIMRERKKFLNNNDIDILKFKVEVDGVSGETSKGDIKSDVDVRFNVLGPNGKKVATINEKVSFSLKTGNPQIESKGITSIYESMVEVFKLRRTAALNAASRMVDKKPKTADGKDSRIKASFAGFKEIYSQLNSLQRSNQSTFNTRAWSYLESSLFGKDYPEIIKVGIESIKTINKDVFNGIKKINTLVAEFEETGSSSYIRFNSRESKKVLFQIRLTVSGDKLQVKIEAGSYLYNLAKTLK